MYQWFVLDQIRKEALCHCLDKKNADLICGALNMVRDAGIAMLVAAAR